MLKALFLGIAVWGSSTYQGAEIMEHVQCVYENGNFKKIVLDHKIFDNGNYADLSFYIPEERMEEFSTLHAGGFEYLSVRIRFQKNQEPEVAFITTLQSDGKDNQSVAIGDDIRSSFNGRFQFVRFISQEQGSFKIFCDIIPK